jgi:hypothetical protein
MSVQLSSRSLSQCLPSPVLTSRWCQENHEFLQSSPKPSPLPFYLHQSVFNTLEPKEAVLYARKHLLLYIPSQQVMQLLTSALYKRTGKPEPASFPYKFNIEQSQLVDLFRLEFGRKQGWAKEDPLEVVVDLGSRGGALHAIEKARRVMGEHLGDVRAWDELPVCHFSIRLGLMLITYRWRSPSLRPDATTRSLSVQYQRNKRQTPIRQRCSSADIPSLPRALIACSSLGMLAVKT